MRKPERSAQALLERHITLLGLLVKYVLDQLPDQMAKGPPRVLRTKRQFVNLKAHGLPRNLEAFC